MAVLTPRASHVRDPLTRRAWIALALVPVGWVLSLSAALTADDGLGDATASGVALGLVALAAPTAAVILSDVADRADEHSAGAAVALSAVLFFLTIVAPPRVLVSVPAFVVALALCLVALSVGLAVARRRSEPPR